MYFTLVNIILVFKIVMIFKYLILIISVFNEKLDLYYVNIAVKSFIN